MSEKTCLTYDEISEAIANGNTKQVKEMFEGFHVFKGKNASIRVTASALKFINFALRIGLDSDDWTCGETRRRQSNYVCEFHH